MFRRLLILGAIAALFTIATVVPASAVAVNTGPGHGDDTQTAKTVVPQFTDAGEFSDAHGPLCGDLPDCPNNDSHAGGINPGGLENPFGDQNVGAWNGVFQSNEASAVCGITAEIDEVPDLGGNALELILLANTCES
jgi:hypothetical protein